MRIRLPLPLVVLAASAAGPFLASAGPETPPGGEVRGLLLAADGRPTVGAVIEAVEVSRVWYSAIEAAMGYRGPLVPLPADGRAESGADGRFTITVPTPGAYVLRAVDAAGAMSVFLGASARPGGGPRLGCRMRRAVDVAGAIIDRSGRPVPGLTVAAGPVLGIGPQDDPYAAAVGRVFAKTDVEGRFAIRGVPAVGRSRRGEDAAVLIDVAVDAGDGRVLHVSIDPAAIPKDLKIPLDGTASLTGVVRGKVTGRPMGGARVTGILATEEGRAPAGSTFLGVSFVATTGADGTYRVSGLPAGDLVEIGAFVEGTGIGMPEGPEVDAGRIRVPDGAAKALDLPVTKAVPIGVLVRGPDGRPMAGVRVAGMGAVFPHQRTTDAEGRAAFLTLEGAEYGVAALAPGLAARAAERSPSQPGDGRPLEHVLLLVSAGRIDGHVIGLDGKPASGVAVTLTSDGYAGFGRDMVKTGLDGSFVLQDLPPGRFTVSAESRDGSVKGGGPQVDVAVGAVVSGVELRLSPP